MIDIRQGCVLVDINEYPEEVEEKHAEGHGEVGDAEHEHDHDRCLQDQSYEQWFRKSESVTE